MNGSGNTHVYCSFQLETAEYKTESLESECEYNRITFSFAIFIAVYLIESSSKKNKFFSVAITTPE